MKQPVHLLLPDRGTVCGLPVSSLSSVKHTDRIGDVTCGNCESKLKSQNRAAYWDYDRGEADLVAAEPELRAFIDDIKARFRYLQGEVRLSLDHIARTVRFWIPVQMHGSKTHALNISHTAIPLYIAVRTLNEGERVMIAEALAALAERLHLRIQLERGGPDLSFIVKPFFHKRERGNRHDK